MAHAAAWRGRDPGDEADDRLLHLLLDELSGFLFRIAATGYHFGNLNGLADSIDLPWIDLKTGGLEFKIDYFLGVDGLSLPMVILNALLTMLAIIGGWEKVRVKEYMALMLILEAGVMGVFLAADLLLFFLFWEVELAPMFLLIGIWGAETMKHGMPGRIYSAWKFLLYTFFGSVFMLIGILLLYFTNISNHGQATASMVYFSTHFFNGTVQIPLIGVTMGLQLLTFLLIFLAFAIKIPMFPFHTWLPDAHTDAPTEVSVILAGILLKMGAYGLIRICFTLLPFGAHEFAPALGVFGLVYVIALFLVKQNYEMLPADYEEAARVDGAGTLRIIFQIYVPMLRRMLHEPRAADNPV